MQPAEVLLGQAVGEIQLIELVALGIDFPQFGLGAFDQGAALAGRDVSGFGVCGDLIGRKQELRELRTEHFFEIVDRDLVAAGLADVLGGLAPHVHLAPTGAEGLSGEEIDRA
ncbi:hypothetical protein, partial [Phenylobacterium sp.]|uniref:hypothetical protein n=1 Tax=Phenylobacterium sp. TaxID=1871053 RepID=UPI0025DDDB19